MKWSFLFLMLVFIACSSQKQDESVPEDIIPSEKFSEIMTDIHLLEAVSNQKMIREDDPKVMTAVYYNQIFEKHKITKESFDKSYHYWASRPEEMMLIYDQVINNLNKMEEEQGSQSKDE